MLFFKSLFLAFIWLHTSSAYSQELNNELIIESIIDSLYNLNYCYSFPLSYYNCCFENNGVSTANSRKKCNDAYYKKYRYEKKRGDSVIKRYLIPDSLGTINLTLVLFDTLKQPTFFRDESRRENILKKLDSTSNLFQYIRDVKPEPNMATINFSNFNQKEKFLSFINSGISYNSFKGYKIDENRFFAGLFGFTKFYYNQEINKGFFEFLYFGKQDCGYFQFVIFEIDENRIQIVKIITYGAF